MQNNSINRNAIVEGGAEWFLRLALAAGFLAAVTDRFGLLGTARCIQRGLGRMGTVNTGLELTHGTGLN